jgi:hypothetical protein
VKRSAPLRAKAPAPRPAKTIDYVPRPRAFERDHAASADKMARPVPKANPVRDEAYRRLVAALPCAHCGVAGLSQAAHADEGKGLGLKACDLTCFPLCGPRPSEPGCHWLIGTSGRIPRDERRELEARYGAQTRAKLGR